MAAGPADRVRAEQLGMFVNGHPEPRRCGPVRAAGHAHAQRRPSGAGHHRGEPRTGVRRGGQPQRAPAGGPRRSARPARSGVGGTRWCGVRPRGRVGGRHAHPPDGRLRRRCPGLGHVRVGLGPLAGHARGPFGSGPPAGRPSLRHPVRGDRRAGGTGGPPALAPTQEALRADSWRGWRSRRRRSWAIRSSSPSSRRSPHGGTSTPNCWRMRSPPVSRGPAASSEMLARIDALAAGPVPPTTAPLRLLDRHHLRDRLELRTVGGPRPLHRRHLLAERCRSQR